MSNEASTIIQGYLKRMQDEYENFNTVYNDLLTKLNLAQTEYTKQDSQFKKLLTDETNSVTIYSSSTRQNFNTEFEKVQSAAQAKILNISQVPEELDEFIKLANLDLEGVRNQLNEISQNVAAIKDEANAQIDSINRELPKVTEAGQKAIEDMNKVVNQVTASGQTLQQQINELDLRLSGIVNNQSNISKDITAIQETNKAINASQEALLKLIDKTDDRIDQINQQIGDIVKIRTDIDTLETEKADKTFVDAQLAEKTQQISDITINPIVSFNAKDIIENSVYDNSSILQNAINYAITNNLNLVSDKTFYIATGLVVDFQGKSNLKIGLKLKPIADIGTAILVKNGYNNTIDIAIVDGGSSTDTGLEIIEMNTPRIFIRGIDFLGTLFRVSGSDATSDKNVGCTVEVKSERCGRAITHGDGVNSSSFFGVYTSIFDRGSTNGSIFQHSNDITIQHYENSFFQSDKISLLFDTCLSVHCQTIALGGRADYLLKINDTSATIDKVLVVNEDTAGQNTKGINITSTLPSTAIRTSRISIQTVEGWNMNSIIDIDSNSKLNAFTIKPVNTTTYTLRKDLVDTGLSKTNESSYSVALSLAEGTVGTLVNKNSISGISGTGLTHIFNITFSRPHLTIPTVVANTHNINQIACVQSVTTTGCNIIVSRKTGVNLATELINVDWISIG